VSWTLYLLYTNFRNLKKRVKLDRRRLEAAHLKYAFLITATNYHGLFSTSDMAVYPNIQETLQRITPKYYSGFQTRYFGKESIGFQHTQLYVHVHEYTSLGHSCTFPGCGTVLILDGNMKNRRDIVLQNLLATSNLMVCLVQSPLDVKPHLLTKLAIVTSTGFWLVTLRLLIKQVMRMFKTLMLQLAPSYVQHVKINSTVKTL
jgi:hypothetical protein